MSGSATPRPRGKRTIHPACGPRWNPFGCLLLACNGRANVSIAMALTLRLTGARRCTPGAARQPTLSRPSVSRWNRFARDDYAPERANVQCSNVVKCPRLHKIDDPWPPHSRPRLSCDCRILNKVSAHWGVRVGLIGELRWPSKMSLFPCQLSICKARQKNSGFHVPSSYGCWWKRLWGTNLSSISSMATTWMKCVSRDIGAFVRQTRSSAMVLRHVDSEWWPVTSHDRWDFEIHDDR